MPECPKSGKMAVRQVGSSACPIACDMAFLQSGNTAFFPLHESFLYVVIRLFMRESA